MSYKTLLVGTNTTTTSTSTAPTTTTTTTNTTTNTITTITTITTSTTTTATHMTTTTIKNSIQVTTTTKAQTTNTDKTTFKAKTTNTISTTSKAPTVTSTKTEKLDLKTEVKDCTENDNTSTSGLDNTSSSKATVLSETSHDSGIYSAKNLFYNTATTTTTSTAATTNKSNTTDDPTTHLTLKTWNFPDEHKLAKNTILETLPTLGKQWSVVLQFKPTQYVDNMTTNILYMVQNGKREYTTLRIRMLRGTNKLIVDSVVTGGQNIRKSFMTQLALNVWTNIKISQRLFEGQYMFRILVDNNKLFSTENNKAQQFSNVSVYASSPWMTAQPGLIRNLNIITSKETLKIN